MSELRTLFSATPPEGWLGCIDALHPHRDRETGERARLMPEWILASEPDKINRAQPEWAYRPLTDVDVRAGCAETGELLPALNGRSVPRRRRPGGVRHRGRRAKRQRR